MKKLYYIKQINDVMFLSDEKGIYLIREGNKFLKEEISQKDSATIKVDEITCASDVPEHWRNALPWGQDDDEELTTIEYLKAVAKIKDPEYKVYLRLKKKFEGVDDE